MNPESPNPALSVSSEAAIRWAASRFPEELRPVAAIVGDILCGQFGVEFSALEPHYTFVADLRMEDLEPVEVVMALEQKLGIAIPSNDTERLDTIFKLVEYLHSRIGEP